MNCLRRITTLVVAMLLCIEGTCSEDVGLPALLFDDGVTAKVPCIKQGEDNDFFWSTGESYDDASTVAYIARGIPSTSNKYSVQLDGTLIIQNISLADEGNYFCRILSDSTESYIGVKVYVRVSVETLDVTIDECQPTSNCVKVLKPSQEYQARCTANKVSESMELKWYNGTKEITEGAVTTIKDETGRNVKMTSVISFIFEEDFPLSCEAEGLNIPRNLAVIQLKKEGVLISDEKEENTVMLIIPSIVLGALCFILICLVIFLAIKYKAIKESRGKDTEEVSSENEEKQKEQVPLLGLKQNNGGQEQEEQGGKQSSGLKQNNGGQEQEEQGKQSSSSENEDKQKKQAPLLKNATGVKEDPRLPRQQEELTQAKKAKEINDGEVKRLQKEVTQNEKDIKSKDEEISNLKLQLQEKQKIVENIEEDKRRKEEEVRQTTMTYKDEKRLVSERDEQRLQNEMKTNKDILDKKIQELNLQLGEKDKLMKQFETDLKNKERVKDLEEKDKLMKKTEADLKNKEQQVKELNSQLEENDKLIKGFEADLRNKEHTVNRLQKDMKVKEDAINKGIQELQSQLEEKDKVMKQIETHLETKVENLISEISQMKKRSCENLAKTICYSFKGKSEDRTCCEIQVGHKEGIFGELLTKYPNVDIVQGNNLQKNFDAWSEDIVQTTFDGGWNCVFVFGEDSAVSTTLHAGKGLMNSIARYAFALLKQQQERGYETTIQSNVANATGKQNSKTMVDPVKGLLATDRDDISKRYPLHSEDEFRQIASKMNPTSNELEEKGFVRLFIETSLSQEKTSGVLTIASVTDINQIMRCWKGTPNNAFETLLSEIICKGCTNLMLVGHCNLDQTEETLETCTAIAKALDTLADRTSLRKVP